MNIAVNVIKGQTRATQQSQCASSNQNLAERPVFFYSFMTHKPGKKYKKNDTSF